jgi:LysR family transcriptional activator of nhaA
VLNLKHLYYFWQVAKQGGVVKAAEQMHLTPQTVSGQLQSLEESTGAQLFARRGRGLELTERGRSALGYAEEIFSLTGELEHLLAAGKGRAGRIAFRVGVADAVPKALAYRILSPATQISQPVRLVCREWKLDSLLAELAAHRIDLVIADTPLPASARVKAYSHRLGSSGISFFAAPAVMAKLRSPRKAASDGFPAFLDGLPMILPGEDAALRTRLERWFNKHRLKPEVVGEFDDSALINAFGQAGVGAFPGPTVLEAGICARYAVEVIGRAPELVEEFFVISVERKVTHPCVRAITDSARDDLFADG